MRAGASGGSASEAGQQLESMALNGEATVKTEGAAAPAAAAVAGKTHSLPASNFTPVQFARASISLCPELNLRPEVCHLFYAFMPPKGICHYAISRFLANG